jgi:N-acetylglutamate synthase-like GNAT family acetyltransferase
MPHPPVSLAIIVRGAQPADTAQMQALLEAEDLDRDAFVLEDFVVAADTTGRFAGCARLKHYDDCVELSSLAVSPAYRGQGVGSTLVETLLCQTQVAVIHLVCEPKETVFFRRFGFITIPREQRPAALEPKLCAYEAKLGAMMVMQYDG